MKNCLLILLCVFTSFSIHANEVFKVYPENGDMTAKIQSAITTSEEENPDPTKHIGLYLKDLENITIDGKGARLVM